MAPKIRSRSRSQFSPVSADTGTISWKAKAARHAAIRGSSFDLGATRSVLFTTAKTGQRPGRRPSRPLVSTRSGFSVASNTKQTISTSSTARSAVFAISSPRRLRPAWSPGVSMKTIWAEGRCLMPVMRVRVVWGRRDTMAIFSPTSRLSSVDLPTLGRPTRATKPARWVAPPISVREQSRPEPGGRTAPRLGEDGARSLVHEPCFSGLVVVPPRQVQDPVHHEEVELEPHGDATAPRLARGGVGAHDHLAEERARARHVEIEGQHVGSVPTPEIARVEAADFAIVHHAHVELPISAAEGVEGALGGGAQPRRGKTDPPLTIPDRDSHQAPGDPGAPPGFARSYARTMAETRS